MRHRLLADIGWIIMAERIAGLSNSIHDQFRATVMDWIFFSSYGRLRDSAVMGFHDTRRELVRVFGQEALHGV